MFTTLVSTEALSLSLSDPDWAIVDCRFILAQPERGRQDYLQSHIPGAVYAHLDEDLSGPVRRGVTGRHPLPEVDQAAVIFGRLGIGPGVQVVAYDDAGGALAAARLWWLLRWLGHDAVAVLDGGWSAWLREGRPVKAGKENRPRRDFVPRPRPELVVATGEIESRRRDPAFRLFDVRLPERYRGEKEPIDPVAGHIPGARSLPYVDNQGPDGKFRSQGALRTMYLAAFGDVPAERAIFYCGSGATAAHNLLAVLHAGLGEARLYAGSWSEWITDAGREIGR